MASPSFDRDVFITDGTQFHPIDRVVVRSSGVYVLDPNAPDAGKISYHSTGAINLGQPKYDPPVLYG